jgi:hypothetical protein
LVVKGRIMGVMGRLVVPWADGLLSKVGHTVPWVAIVVWRGSLTATKQRRTGMPGEPMVWKG